MKGGNAKTLAKIQVRRIFGIRDIRRNVIPKFIEICMADGNQQKHLLPSEFCYKNVNLFFE